METDTYVYDDVDRRVWRSCTRANLLYSYDADCGIPGLFTTTDSTVYDYDYDHCGSPGLTNNKGTSTAVTNTPDPETPDHQESDTDLYHYGLRSYSPELGRWVNRDPIEEAGGAHLHGYVGNNPLSSVDGLGLAMIATKGTPEAPPFKLKPPSWTDVIKCGIEAGGDNFFNFFKTLAENADDIEGCEKIALYCGGEGNKQRGRFEAKVGSRFSDPAFLRDFAVCLAKASLPPGVDNVVPEPKKVTEVVARGVIAFKCNRDGSLKWWLNQEVEMVIDGKTVKKSVVDENVYGSCPADGRAAVSCGCECTAAKYDK